jgi:selenocysteine lyase/cysteine desulfurase
MIDLTGQILPIADITSMAHRHGIPVLVDGAQTFGHVPCTAADLGCDFFATSLHKWMMGPQGTGMLFVRKNRIADLWSLMPAEADQKDNIRKFEDVGTQPPAPFLALGEALSFHRSIGVARKAARLRYLRDYWLSPLLEHDRVRLQTHCPTACALATIHLDGIDPLDLRNYLWNQHRIRVRPIRHKAVEGIRVSPSLYTTPAELNRFVAVMETIIRDGLPSS